MKKTRDYKKKKKKKRVQRRQEHLNKKGCDVLSEKSKLYNHVIRL